MSVASAIEHTRLAADTTPQEIEALCREALEMRCAGVCVSACYVGLAASLLHASGVRVVTVVGFPLGANDARVDAFAAEAAAADGAEEIDMVIPIGLALASDLRAVESHVALVRKALPQSVLKVILETGFFAPLAVESLARAAVAGGADYLKTSTGFGPRGASVEDVRILAAVAASASRSVSVKASGGVRTLEQARPLLAAGATRLGTSRGVAIVAEERAAGEGAG